MRRLKLIVTIGLALLVVLAPSHAEESLTLSKLVETADTNTDGEVLAVSYLAGAGTTDLFKEIRTMNDWAKDKDADTRRGLSDLLYDCFETDGQALLARARNDVSKGMNLDMWPALWVIKVNVAKCYHEGTDIENLHQEVTP
ncbi:MAG: hypothetical protein IIA10_04385 [Proteobacteria bacterium]|nr:hypothetical protein [Pseudomonadota bacterium]